MSICTKFKIRSILLGSRFKRFSTGNEADGGTNNRETDHEDTNIHPPLQNDFHECSKDDINMNCFVSGANAKYMEYLFSKWVKNHNSVHKSWHLYFSEILLSKKNDKKLDSSAVPQTAEEASKEVSEANEDFINLFAKLDEATAPKSVEELRQIEQKSEEHTEMDSGGINNWPPMQGSDSVVGHIILKPRRNDSSSSKDFSDKPKDINDLIANIPKSERRPTIEKDVNTKSKTETKNTVEQAEFLKTIERLKAALERKVFNLGRDDIKEQLKIIKTKKLLKERKKNKGNETKAYTPSEEPRK